MSSTLHKILVHGYKILERSIVPVGSLGESASEARHKHFKADRKFHARKCSRADNMSDVFNRAMDSSDPLLSSLHITKLPRNKKSLPTEVIDLLDVPSCPVTSRLIGANTSQSSSEGDDEEDSEYNSDEENYNFGTVILELEEEVADDIEN